ncbi:hypothetical protein C8Q80DRAFT_1267173 [Daedaleopsis nitida]|nr:hypothetical protein C8Q80DRAFT_1267173 [Daedaleopsis nitida]
MGTHRYHTPEHRARSFSTKLDRARLPRLLLQSALFRARKPSIPRNTLHFMNHPTVKDGRDFLLTPPPPRPYPTIPDEPLVPPHAWRTLQDLHRPPMPEIDEAAIAALQPDYDGIPANYVRDSWSWLGYRALALYQKLQVETPKTALPSEYNVIMHDNGLVTCPTHVFAVYSYPDPSDDDDSGTRRKANALAGRRPEVGLYPTHGAIWAAYCTRLPRMTRAPSPSPSKLVRTKSEGKSAATVVRLPVVPLALPYPPMFLALAAFVNSRVQVHLVVQMLQTANVLALLKVPGMSGRKLDESLRQTIVFALLPECDLKRLCCLARNVHGLYRNIVALGMVDDVLWDTVTFTWSVLRKAMEVAERMAASGVTLADLNRSRNG